MLSQLDAFFQQHWRTAAHGCAASALLLLSPIISEWGSDAGNFNAPLIVCHYELIIPLAPARKLGDMSGRDRTLLAPILAAFILSDG